MNDKKLQQTIDFVRFLNDFQQIKRDLYAVGEDRMENDAEHSFQLAMLAWFINSSQNLGLSEEMLLKYALIHDLVEAYAGDTPVFSLSNSFVESKQKREALAVQQISDKFSGFSDLSLSINNYNKKKDEESKLVYCLDKVLPIMNIWLDNGRSWKNGRGSFAQALVYARSKVRNLEPVKSLMDELERFISKSGQEAFEYFEQVYPLSNASIARDDYRVNYKNKTEKEIEDYEQAMFCQIKAIANQRQAIKSYRNFQFIGNGWEWSVFRKKDKVYKIPAGLFSEVNSEKYLQNTIIAYELLKTFYPNQFLPTTEFTRENNNNLVIQDFVSGDSNFNLKIENLNDQARLNLETLLLSTDNILEQMEWMPDINLSKTKDGFKLTNISCYPATSTPKIIDFTYYYDPFRLYPKLTKIVIADKKVLITELLNQLKQ